MQEHSPTEKRSLVFMFPWLGSASCAIITGSMVRPAIESFANGKTIEGIGYTTAALVGAGATLGCVSTTIELLDRGTEDTAEQEARQDTQDQI